MATYNTQERLRHKGGLKAMFLAAALLVTPANLDFPAQTGGARNFVQNQGAVSSALRHARKVEQDWAGCTENMAGADRSIGDALHESLGAMQGGAVQAALAYLTDNKLRFCRADDRRSANKFNPDTNMLSVLWQDDERLNTLNMLHLAMEHKFSRIMYDPVFKAWDYKSQFVFALAAKGRARAEIGMIAQQIAQENPAYAYIVAGYAKELRSLYDADADTGTETGMGEAAREIAVQDYVTTFLHSPHIYAYYAPQLLTSFFDELSAGRSPERSKHEKTVMWDGVMGVDALSEIGLTAAQIPHKSSFKDLLGQYGDQLSYLSNQRIVPRQYLYGLHNKYAHVDMADLRALYQKTDYILNISQVFERVRKGGSLEHYTQLSAANNAAIQADFMDYQIKDDQAFLWHNIQRLKSKQTIIGQLLYKHAVDYSVFFNEENVDEHATGTWSSYNNMVSVRPHDHHGYDHHYAVGTVAHELLHSVQDRRGTFDYSNHWSLKEYQMQVMSYEAAAFVTARLTAFELQINDHDTAPWQSIAHSDVAKTIAQTYRQHIEVDGTHLESLEYAGAAAWQDVFKSQHWIDTYNKWVIKLYLGKLHSGVLSADRQQDFTLAQARRDGYVSPLFNATARIDTLPPPSDLFGKNNTMRHVFNWIELEYLGQKLGENSAVYIGFKDKLIAHENPFLDRHILKGLDMSDRTAEDIYHQILCAGAQTECTLPRAQPMPPMPQS